MSHLSPRGRTLFEHARRDLAPREEDRRRVGEAIAARLGAAATAATIASTSAAQAATTGLGKGSVAASPAIVKWLCAAALASGIGAAGVSLVHAVRSPGTSAPPAEAPALAAAEAPGPPATAPVEAVEAPTPPEPAPAAPEHAIAPASTPYPPALRPAPPPVARGSVAEEAKLLRDANAALQSGDAAGALALLDEHRRAYPKGTLSEESMAERVFALCRMGRAADARQEARRFLQTYPRSPLAKGIRESCGLYDGASLSDPRPKPRPPAEANSPRGGESSP